METSCETTIQPEESQISSASFDADKPETWACTQVYHPPDFDIQGFQEKLDKLFGLSETGFPIVRLVWPGDIKKCYSKFYISWSGSGFGVDTELRAKYRYASIQIPGTPDIIDVPPPRWILEQFNHPGQYLASWEATRFNKEGREVRPAPPPNGYYSHLWTIARHDEQCCKDAIEKYKVCWGKYRSPDDKDIEMLAAAKQARDRDREIDTTKPLDAITLEAIDKETKDRLEFNEAAAMEHWADFIDENFFEVFEWMTGRKPSPLARRKFTLMKGVRTKNKIKETESGLIVPYK